MKKLRFKQEDGNDYPALGSIAPLESAAKHISSSLGMKSVGPRGVDRSVVTYGASGPVGFSRTHTVSGEYFAVVKDGAGAGRTIKCASDTAFISTLQGIKAKEGFSTEYLYQLFSTLRLDQYSQGTTIPHVYFKDYKDKAFSFPSLPEQERIATFLGLLDERIEAQRILVSGLEQEKRGYMQAMLSPTPTLRFKQEDGTDYPDWEKTTLGEAALIIMGQSPKSTMYNNDNQGLPLLQGNADLKNGTVQPRMFSKQGSKQSSVGDIILSVRAPVGPVAFSDIDSYLGRGVCAIRGPKVIYHLLESFNMEGKWEAISKGTTFGSVTSKDLSTLPVTLPCASEQKKIAHFLDLLDERLFAEKAKLAALELEKKGFAQRVFL